MIHGYARVSTDGQSVDAWVRALRAAGSRQVFRETASGAKTDRTLIRARTGEGRARAPARVVRDCALA